MSLSLILLHHYSMYIKKCRQRRLMLWTLGTDPPTSPWVPQQKMAAHFSKCVFTVCMYFHYSLLCVCTCMGAMQSTNSEYETPYLATRHVLSFQNSNWCYLHYRYISKNVNIVKKVNIFCHSFQKGKPIYYIYSLNIEWNISSLYFLKFWWLWLADTEN